MNTYVRPQQNYFMDEGFATPILQYLKFFIKKKKNLRSIFLEAPFFYRLIFAWRHQFIFPSLKIRQSYDSFF